MSELKKTSSPHLVYSAREDAEEGETIFTLRQKYKDPLLFMLYENPKMLHSNVAHYMQVSQSGLTAIVKKLYDADDEPIEVEKQSKFTFYSLRESGKEYVEQILLPQIIPDNSSESSVHNIVQLLMIFKSHNPKAWSEELAGMLEDPEPAEEQDEEEGYGFIREITSFYARYKRQAERLLELIITDKELQNTILSYMEQHKDVVMKDIWQLLSCWSRESCLEACHLIDDLLLAIPGRRSVPEASDYHLRNVEGNLEVLSDKIQACLLQVMMRGFSKEDTEEMLLGYGLDVHMTAYLAEKFRTFILENSGMEHEKRIIYKSS